MLPCVRNSSHRCTGAVWQNVPPPSELYRITGCTIRIIRAPQNSLHNRFLPIPCVFVRPPRLCAPAVHASSPCRDLKTLAVMSLDDDVRVDLAGVERAFASWQQHPQRHVGFLFVARGAQYNASTNSWMYRNSFPQQIAMYRPPQCSLPSRQNDMCVGVRAELCSTCDVGCVLVRAGTWC